MRSPGGRGGAVVVVRVLHVDTAREWRGGQTQLLHLVRQIPGLGVALPPDAPLRAALERERIPVYPIAFGAPPIGSFALARLVRALDPAVIAAHTSHAHGHGLLAGRPVVVHRRVDFAIRAVARWKYRAATAFVAVSAAVSEVLVAGGVDPARIVVVHDGVDPAPWLAPVDRDAARAALGVPPEARWVAAVGALVEHKGHAGLIDAVAGADGLYCTIAGDGPLRAALAARIAATGQGRRIRLLGARTDVPAWLGAADLFAHPSVEEGLGQAVIEAMLAGVPVVATAAGGVPEIVGADGVTVPVGDVAALSRALIGPLPDGRVARPRILAGFSVDRMVAGTIAAYRRAAREGDNAGQPG